MKKLHLLLAVFAILISCSKSDPENPDPQPEQPKQETITIAGGSDTAPVLGTTGGSSTVTFTASAAWSASVINTRASDWCSVSPTNGQAGTATITITVKENTTPDNRAASVTIKCGNTTSTIKVEQKQKDALTVSQSSIEVPAEGKEIKVVAKSNVTFTHTISTEAQSWIKVVTTKALKDSTLTFEIAKNESIEKRSGEIYLTSGNLKDTVKVHQAGEAPSIVISKDEYVLKSEGENFEVEVASNVNAIMNLAFPEGVEPWIAENTTRAMSTNKYIFVASANETYDSRSAMIIFANAESNVSDTVRVTQAQKDAIVVAKSSYNVENAGGTIEIEVGHNVDYEYTITSEWITKVDTRAMTTDKLLFVVAENTSYDNREGAITFTANGGAISQEVKVYQSEKGALIISKKDYVINDAGGEITMEIQSNVEFSVTAPSVDWLHDITTKGLQTHTLKYQVDANGTYDSRSTQIYVNNLKTGSQDTLTITQTQKDAIVLAKSDYEFGKVGGNLDFEILTNVDITVTIPDSCATWISQVETRALETKTLYFNIAACDTLKTDRVGFITISGGNAVQTIKVVQSIRQEILAAERESLIQFYKEMGGDNWTNKANWCSDRPVREWYGISVNENGQIKTLHLIGNNMTGDLSVDYLSKLTNLEILDLSYNNLTGKIPAGIGEIQSLKSLSLGNNQFSGTIPAELGQLHNLEFLALGYNQLTGPIPLEIKNLVNLHTLVLEYNELSGEIPKGVWTLNKLEILNLRENRLSGSLPEDISNLTEIKEISLGVNELEGEIPVGIGKLMNMELLNLRFNKLSGNIPLELASLTNLKELYLGNNSLSGSIPKELGNLKELRRLELRDNNLTGEIPEELGNLPNIEPNNYLALDISENYLTGRVPASITNHPNWKMGGWAFVLKQKGEGLDKDGIVIRMPQFNSTTIDGEFITNDYFSQNEYTVIFHFVPNDADAYALLPIMGQLYKQYKSEGLAVVSLTSEFDENIYKTIINDFDIPWSFIFHDTNDSGRGTANIFRPYTMMTCQFTIFNRKGELIYCDYAWNASVEDPVKVITDKFGPIGDIEMYESTDYSADGSVSVIQTAKVGNGIDIVLMGDGYSDRLVADGTYESAMNKAYEKFFSVEPYKSFKDYFNVYSVKAVSKNEVYYQGCSTAFSGFFAGATVVGGDNDKVLSYAQKAVSSERLDNAVVIVLMNSKAYAGTCYMYYPEGGDYGNGVSVSYFPTGADEQAMERVLHHEAGGHGFAKLADEYVSSCPGGPIPESVIQSNRTLEAWGWIKNIDFTSDPLQVKWAHFIKDSRYQYDGLEVFEGGFGYEEGVWRPTYNSIMNDNTGGFNAPSREAIYYRIHKLAYGPEWEYDYEKFVEYDAKNRKTESQSQARPLVLKPQEDFVPLHPPVIIPHTWREAQRTK